MKITIKPMQYCMYAIKKQHNYCPIYHFTVIINVLQYIVVVLMDLKIKG